MKKVYFTILILSIAGIIFFLSCKKEYSCEGCADKISHRWCSGKTYTSFSDLAEQIGMSRVYAGIHTRYACEAGRTQGEKIAENILSKVKFKKD